MGPTELIIILVIVLVLFGVGRIGKIGGELGKGIRAFRQGVKDTDNEGVMDEESDQEES
jgi:sec-independent protein translocase protein TatA